MWRNSRKTEQKTARETILREKRLALLFFSGLPGHKQVSAEYHPMEKKQTAGMTFRPTWLCRSGGPCISLCLIVKLSLYRKNRLHRNPLDSLAAEKKKTGTDYRRSAEVTGAATAAAATAIVDPKEMSLIRSACISPHSISTTVPAPGVLVSVVSYMTAVTAAINLSTAIENAGVLPEWNTSRAVQAVMQPTILTLPFD